MRRARVTLPDGRVRETLFASATEPADSWRWLPPVEGTVVGALLNYRGELDALSDTLSAPPYQAPPKAPILYLKPANTRIGHGHEVALPADVDGVWAGACLGVAISCTATRVPAQHAADIIAGYTIVNDLTVPHASYYRPAIRHKCRDGFARWGPGWSTATMFLTPMHSISPCASTARSSSAQIRRRWCGQSRSCLPT